MPWGLERWHGGRDLHFLTFSCYRRQPLLASARHRLVPQVRPSVGLTWGWGLPCPGHSGFRNSRTPAWRPGLSPCVARSATGGPACRLSVCD